MKKILIIVIVSMLGIGLTAYPHIAKYVTSLQQSTAVQEFDEEVKRQDPEILAKEWEKAVLYNQSMTGKGIEDPFMQGSGKVMPENYLELLNIGGVMGHINIPKINVNLSIYHGTSSKVLDIGIGHLEGSSLPVGGEGTHTVLTGHTGVASGKLFTDLIELTEGDVFYLYILDQILAYEVDQIKVVDPSDTEELRTVAGADYATLITCTPYGVNSHRLLVRGVRIPYEAGQQEEAQKEAVTLTKEDRTLLIAGVITSMVMLLLIIVTWIITRKQIKKQVSYWWNNFT